jgi:hypothetical protein
MRYYIGINTTDLEDTVDNYVSDEEFEEIKLDYCN